MKTGKIDDGLNMVLAESISKENFDCAYYADLVLKDADARRDILALTFGHPHIMVYYHGYYILDKAAEENPGLFYEYWSDFAGLLAHKNTYHRQIGITLIARLSKADTENRFTKIRNAYLKRLYDEKMLIGVLTARYLRTILQNKPEYLDSVVTELMKHRDKTPYTEKQEALFECDVLDIFDDHYEAVRKNKKIDEYILARMNSASPKTKKKSRQLVKKYGIPVK